MRHPLLPAAILAVAGTACGCTRQPAVQPYGSIASAGKTRTLSAGEVAPVDDFLKRHQPLLGILAAPAPAATDPTRAPVARPAAAAQGAPPDNRRPDLTIR